MIHSTILRVTNRQTGIGNYSPILGLQWPSAPSTFAAIWASRGFKASPNKPTLEGPVKLDRVFIIIRQLVKLCCVKDGDHQGNENDDDSSRIRA